MKLYVASPLGFSKAGRDFYYRTLIPLLHSRGCEILDPWALTSEAKIAAVVSLPFGSERREAWRVLNVEIGHTNTDAIARADALFAVLDGVDVDSGTAAEIGCAFAWKKKILGYRGDTRLLGENEGALVNLQVEYFIRASGGTIVTDLDSIPAALASLRG